MLNMNINDFKNNFGDCFDKAATGEIIAISGDGADAVLLSRNEYEHLANIRRNEYFAKLDKGLSDIRAGEGVVVSVDELERMTE
jgi:prevent-host-death family protein